MNKLLWGFIILMLPLSVCASPIDITAIDTTLNDDPTSASSSAVYIADWTNPTMYVSYTEPAIATAASVTFSVDFSVDGTNWVDARWFDLAGGTTLQTSEVFASDANYIAWLNKSANYPFIRVLATGSNTDATNTATIKIDIVGRK